MKNLINIVFTIDKNFIPHFAVALTSLLETNMELVDRVFLIHDISDDSELSILRKHFDRRYGINIECFFMDATAFESFKITHHFSKAANYRLLLDKILPPNVDSVLFLDSDIVVNGDLSELSNINFGVKSPNDEGNIEEYLIHAVDHKMATSSLLRLRETGFNSEKYFNSGVMYINLERWRVLELSNLLMQNATRFRECLLWLDQDVLNITLENRWGVLEYKYNGFDLEESNNHDIRIVHFTGKDKPWHLVSKHPYKKLYWKYRRMTPYKAFLPDDFSIANFIKWIIPVPVKRTIKRFIG